MDLESFIHRRAFLLRATLAGLAAFGLVAVACGGDDDDSSANTPAATTAASSAASPASGGASATAPAQAKTSYPLKVKDLLGRDVEIKQKPTTIVALSPTATELVYAAGGTIAGRTSSVDFPEAAKQAKDVGSAYQPNFETILALKPDLIVADSVIHAQPQLRDPIERLGVPVIFAGADSYQHVIDGLALMGKVLDGEAKTNEVKAGIDKAMADAKAALAGKNITAVALIADRDQTLYAAKSNSYAGDIMAKLGIQNPAASQPDAGPFPGYTTVPAEKLVQFNPDYILAITPAPPPAPRLAELIPQIPPFKGLKAVQNKGVVDADVQLFLQAPGPRIADAFRAIAKAVSGQ